MLPRCVQRQGLFAVQMQWVSGWPHARGVPPQMENGTNVQSVQPGLPPQIENGRSVQSVQPPPPGVPPQMENACTVQSVQPPPPPISGGRMVSGTTLMPRSLILGIRPPSE